MVNPRLLSRLCLGLALFFGASGLVEAGEEPAALATCVACHGKNGSALIRAMPIWEVKMRPIWRCS